MPSTPSQNPDNSSGLLKTLGAVFSGVLFGLFLSKLKSPTQQSVGSVSSNTDSDSETNRGNVLPSVPTQTLPSPPNPGNPCQCCHHRIPRWKIALDVGMFLATVGAFIAAAIYAGITHRMWTEMQQQTCIQREATTNAKRAWIGLSETPKVQVSSLAGKTYSANTELSIKNFGEGPAQNVFFMSQPRTCTGCYYAQLRYDFLVCWIETNSAGCL
jgi:hypothetical protein